MDFPLFLNSLFEQGRVRVARFGPIPAEQQRQAEEILTAFERQVRLETPGTPPDLSLPAARWAAEQLYRACQFLVDRDLDEEVMSQWQTNPPTDDSPATHYSVDLSFRFLPDVVRHARTASEQDALVGQLMDWANRWPLSSVGIPGVVAESIDGFAGHPCLLRMYVDRIIASRDVSRLTDQRVRSAVVEALGMHKELAPELASALTGERPSG